MNYEIFIDDFEFEFQSVDIGAGLVLSIWFALAISYLTLETSDAMYNELLMRVKRWLTNRLHGKAAEHS